MVVVNVFLIGYGAVAGFTIGDEKVVLAASFTWCMAGFIFIPDIVQRA
jgi:hypothetical protein